jgi:hypothetical protein
MAGGGSSGFGLCLLGRSGPLVADHASTAIGRAGHLSAIAGLAGPAAAVVPSVP